MLIQNVLNQEELMYRYSRRTVFLLLFEILHMRKKQMNFSFHTTFSRPRIKKHRCTGVPLFEITPMHLQMTVFKKTSECKILQLLGHIHNAPLIRVSQKWTDIILLCLGTITNKERDIQPLEIICQPEDSPSTATPSHSPQKYKKKKKRKPNTWYCSRTITL